jgi:dipeptidyl aminopeptidase/acylaminoacyl peptidase
MQNKPHFKIVGSYAYLDKVVVERIHAVDTESMPNQDQDRTITPDLSRVFAGRSNTAMRSEYDLRFVDHASIRCDINTKPGFWESMYQFPEGKSVDGVVKGGVLRTLSRQLRRWAQTIARPLYLAVFRRGPCGAR